MNGDAFEADLAARRARAAAVFPGSGRELLRNASVLLASSCGPAIDYIEQAPMCVILECARFGVISPSRHMASLRRGVRERMAASFAKRVAHRPKLRALLEDICISRAHEAAQPLSESVPPGLYQLRRLSGRALRQTHVGALMMLATIDSSTLAQLIPSKWSRQEEWLRVLTAWHEQMLRRLNPVATAHAHIPAEWRAAHVAARVASTGCRRAVDGQHMADFMVVQDPSCWSILTPARFRAAMAEWDRTSANAAREGASTLVVDYSPLPNIPWTMDGFEFVPMRTQLDLVDESQRMSHCVHSYWSAVRSGASRIFSIRAAPLHPGPEAMRNPVATLEMARYGSKWHLAQIKGHSNKPPQPGPLSAAHAFVDFHNMPKASRFDVDPEVAA